MYEIPSDMTIEKCIITAECVSGKSEPIYVYNENREPIKREKKKKKKVS